MKELRLWHLSKASPTGRVSAPLSLCSPNLFRTKDSQQAPLQGRVPFVCMRFSSDSYLAPGLAGMLRELQILKRNSGASNSGFCKSFGILPGEQHFLIPFGILQTLRTVDFFGVSEFYTQHSAYSVHHSFLSFDKTIRGGKVFVIGLYNMVATRFLCVFCCNKKARAIS